MARRVEQRLPHQGASLATEPASSLPPSQHISPDMSQMTPTFAAQSYHLYVRRFRGEFITIGLLCSLYGVLVILSLISTYALTRRSGKLRPTVIVLCLTTFVLFISTTTYLITCVLYYQSDFLDSFLSSPDLLWPGSYLMDSVPDDLVQESRSGSTMTAERQACASAATLTINVILGDAVVCWRACAVWRKNHTVKAVCGVFLLVTFILGVIDTVQGCHPTESSEGDDTPFVFPGTLFEGLQIGVAACVLSLTTNLLATVLVAYKAWESRRRLRGYLVAKVGGSQVEKFLALLIESGAMYSAIWAVVVAYQFAQYKYTNTFTSISPTETGFIDTFGAIMSGALVPLIAIYPAVIIVLVALNKSHIENGLTQNAVSLPTSQPQGLTLSTIISTGPTQSRSSRARDVLVIDGENSGGRIEDSSTDTREVRKPETYRLARSGESEETLLAR